MMLGRDNKDCFRNKVAIVTGGASGIGKAICEALGKRGATVIAADVNEPGAQQVAAAVSSGGGQGHAVFLDVSKEEAVNALVRDTTADHGRLDYMFNNAGIATLGEVRDMTREQWQQVIDINLMGVLCGTTAAYEVMVEQGFGHIINTASHAGLHAVAGTTAYAATKHGVVGLSTSLRAEGAGLGVKVSVLCPGPVKSNIIDAATMVTSFRENFFKKMPQFMLMDTDLAAEAVLRGIVRNQGIMVFPFHARVLWWLHRMNPAIPIWLAIQGMRMFRQYREDS